MFQTIHYIFYSYCGLDQQNNFMDTDPPHKLFPKTVNCFMPRESGYKLTLHKKNSVRMNKIQCSGQGVLHGASETHVNLFFTMENPHCSKKNHSVNINRSIEQVYQIKKNAYSKYIKEIYSKINDQLRKKNSFLNVTAQNIQKLDYASALTVKQVKPVFAQDETKEFQMIQKKIKDKLRLQKLQQQSSSLQKLKKKMISFRKDRQAEQLRNVVDQQKVFVREKGPKRITEEEETQVKTPQKQQKQQILNEKTQEKAEETPKKRKLQPQLRIKRKQRIFSINSMTSPIIPKNQPQDYVPLRKVFNKKDPFVCGLSDKMSVQQKNKQRIVNYVDFLWKINYSNGLYVKSTQSDAPYKAYFGPGNNSLMLKSILKRRFWWTINDKVEGSNFVWTQLKVNCLFKDMQSPSKTNKQLFYTVNQQDIQQIPTICADTQESNPLKKIFNNMDYYNWMGHYSKNKATEIIINQKTYLKRFGLLTRKNIRKIQDPRKLVVHNHVQSNFFIGNKKALFYYMKQYYTLLKKDVFQVLPLTFHIIKGINDPEYKIFTQQFLKGQQLKKNSEYKNMWIMKPGQNSNRGNGISVCHFLDDIVVRLKSNQRGNDGNLRSFILQKYIQKPLLYKSRKFDIRHYMLLTCFNGVFKAYWFPQGYIRTSSSTFTLKRDAGKFVHLTNDAIQKQASDYGKYEQGNKISYQKFQHYLDKNMKGKDNKNIFYDQILPRMKEIAADAVKATYLTLDQKRKQHNFELLGMDFMIDQGMKPWLIEINTNPCLEMSSPLLSRLIPSVIQNTFRICVDPFFPPPEQWSTSKKLFIGDNALEQNKFQLIFDEMVQGRQLQKLYGGKYVVQGNMGKVQQDADLYEDDGVQQWDQGQQK